MSSAATRHAAPLERRRTAVETQADRWVGRVRSVVAPIDPVERERDLALALRIVAASTRVGMSIGDAFDDAGRHVDGAVGAACREAGARIGLGVELRDAMQPVIDVAGGRASMLLCEVLAVRHRRGGDIGDLCHRLSQLLHDRYRLDREVRSLTAQARFSARAVVAMPAVAAGGWAVLAPTSFRQLLTPGVALVISPALLLLLAGVIVVRRIATGALELDPEIERGGGPGDGSTRVSRLLDRVSGHGSIMRRSLRLTTLALALDLVLLSGGHTPPTLACVLLITGCAAAWPTLHARNLRDRRRDAGATGAAMLLELSLALLASGASPRETVLESARRCGGALHALLAPAVAHVELGRTPAAAFGSLDVVRDVPELEAWLLALVHGDRHGAPAASALEALLRDVRTAERERVRSRAAIAAPRMQLAVVLLVVPAIMWIVLTVAATGLARQVTASGMLG